MSSRKLTRREFLRVSALGVVGVAVAGCKAPATETPAPTVKPTEAPTVAPTVAPTEAPTVAAPVSMYKESPMLAAKVEAGELPPVDERLPENPRVIKALTPEQGIYGGEMRVGFVGTSPEWGAMLFVAAWEHLVQWKPDFSGYEPNLAESIEVSEDVKEYTFHLRKGIKWSDGEPFTADDIMFYIEDVLFDPDLSPSGPVTDWLPTDMAADFKAQKIDDYTVKFIFPKPYGTLLYHLAAWPGRYFAFYPKHYLQQFHKKYNPKVDELVEKEGDVADWMGLFFKYGPDTWANPGRFYQYTEYPSLYPWITTQPLGTGTQVRLERNPYYWKVDEQGNQLPYIDKILGISYQDAESRTLAMMNGDLDFVKDPGGENRILYHDAMNEGKPLQIKYPLSDGGNTNTIHFNQTVADTFKAEVFASKDFRIGMSHAINRPEIIEIVHAGQGKPAQHAPLEDSPFYIEGMDTQYVEYDVAKANEYLDKVLPDKDAEGFRLDKNGKRFQIIFTVQNDLSYGTTYVQVAELLIGYWKKVGVEVLLNSIPSAQHDELKKKNQIEATIFTGEGGAGVTPILDPRYYVPMEYFGYFGLGWYGWRVPDPTGETVAVEPPQWAKDARAKYEEAIAQPTFERQVAKMREVIQEAKERFYVLGISRPGPMYYPFHARLGGIPDTWYDGWNEGVQKILFPEQWFLRE
ncbi:MAG: ABC transporter substrate-binding protein [Anaerolineae bacterium]|nr:ABC transporter substrate-binding protein [Anaerolineae bacterium]